jgi:hypothetical protein
MNRIFGLLAQWGLRLSLQRLREPDAMRLLEQRGVPEVWRRSIAEALTVIDLLDARIGPLDVELGPLARADARVRLLDTIPGVGFPEKRDLSPATNCAAGRRISAREVEYLNERTRALNAAIAGVARAHGAEFVDVTDAFDGAELRCTGKTYVNRLRVRAKLFPASFHPNAAGHERLAEVVAAQLAADEASRARG